MKLRRITAVFVVALFCTAALSQDDAATDAEQESLQTEAAAEDTANSEDNAADGLGDDDILDLDIEQLGRIDVVVPSFQVKVTSVTRSESTVGKSPASVFVITQEMIRRSGANSLPEALRLAPGLLVARVDGNKWAISSRGFSGVFANKLLVLIDGVTVYSPVFSGVHWETQDVVLENIERIEVIRGPGASVWGANAVNGVINVITKHSRDTVGLHGSAGVGTEDRSINVLRAGGRSDRWAYRIHGKHSERDTGGPLNGTPADDWRQLRAGARADWSSCSNDCQHLMLSTEFTGTDYGSLVANLPTPTPPFLTSFPRDNTSNAGFFQARWSEKRSSDESYWVQTYFATHHLDTIYAKKNLNIFDVEFQHSLQAFERHQFTWGLGYRSTWDELTLADVLSPVRFVPSSLHTNLFSGYIQDEVTLVEDELFLLAGCRFEHNSYSGFEIQPTLRLLKVLDERQAAWIAASRAVRAPSRIDAGIRTPFFDAPTGRLVQLHGSENIEAEDLFAFEVGYRAQPNDNFSWDSSFFLHEYSDLVSFSPIGLLPGLPPGLPPILAGPLVNQGNATFWGFETSAKWQVNPNWQLSGWYAFMTGALRDLPIGGGNTAPAAFAQNQCRVTSSHDLSDSVQLDAMLRFVDEVEAFQSPSYATLDLRLGWQIDRDWNASIVGQNLLDSAHVEARQPQTFEAPTSVQRGVYFQLSFNR